MLKPEKRFLKLYYWHFQKSCKRVLCLNNGVKFQFVTRCSHVVQLLLLNCNSFVHARKSSTIYKPQMFGDLYRANSSLGVVCFGALLHLDIQ